MNEFIEEEKLNLFFKAFEKFDKNKEGTINIKDVEELMKAFDLNKYTNQLNDRFNEIDIDGKGVIDFKQLMSLLASKEADPDHEFIEAFKILDKDGTGFIKNSDLKIFMQQYKEKVSDDEIDEMIKQADLDQKGHITYEEFVKLLTE